MGYVEMSDKFRDIKAQIAEQEKDFIKVMRKQQIYAEFTELIKSAKPEDLPEIEKQLSEKLESIQTEIEKKKAEAEKIKEFMDKPIEESGYPEYM